MSEESPDRLERLATHAGLLTAGSLLLVLAALALGSEATFFAAAAFGVVVVAVLAVTAIWTAWRALSWRSLFLVAAPFVGYGLSFRVNTTGSGLSWLGTYFALTATLSLCVGLTASRSPSVLARAVALSVAFASLFAFFFVLCVFLVWDGDLN